VSNSPSAPPSRRFGRLGPDDADRYAAHLLRLDAADRRFRFFKDVAEFLIHLHAGAAASDGRIVAVCEEGGEVRAAGELLVDPERPDVGEVAFSVEKDWRRKGLGCALMRELIDAGARAGLARLELEVLPDNQAMLTLAKRFADKIETREGHLFAAIALPAAGVTPEPASAQSPGRDRP
jgi:RimJ/RimL family protein N-acetyltransferase